MNDEEVKPEDLNEIEINEEVMKQLISDHCTFFGEVAQMVAVMEETLFNPLHTKDKVILDSKMHVDRLKHILRKTFEKDSNEESKIKIIPISTLRNIKDN